MIRLFFILSMGIVLGACDDNGIPNQNFSNAWLLYERGYSPGAGYITESVPDNPAQIIRLMEENRFSSNIEGLEKFGYYRILSDTTSDYPVLALFETSSEADKVLDINKLEHSYIMESTGDTMKLYFRWCFEGCHLGFRKMSHSLE